MDPKVQSHLVSLLVCHLPVRFQKGPDHGYASINPSEVAGQVQLRTALAEVLTRGCEMG